jgi:formylglycine-generating enzyme required for sulfatase activity
MLFLQEGNTRLLTHTVLPANATNKNIRWLSKNPGIAIVTGGAVYGVASGTATITAITEDGEFEAACTVTVVHDLPEFDDMVWINPGIFLMGSPVDEPETFDDEVLHQVTLTEGFYMGIYPVTQKQYLEVMGENPSSCPIPGFDGFADRWEEFPVDSVNWYEAIVFCNKLSMNKGLSPAYTIYKRTAPGANNPDNWEDVPGNWSTNPNDWGSIPYSDSARWNLVRETAGSNGYRLPTEAQWEYACRAGTTGPFNTGDNITTDQANYLGWYPYNNGGEFDPEGECFFQTIPSGMYEPNAWGLYDMHGNVAEWCRDWHGSYRRAENTNPTGPNSGEYRIVRGGSFLSDGGYLRSAYRNGETPDIFDQTIGFRIVRPY